MEIPLKGFYYHHKHDPRGEFNNYSYEVVGVARNTEDKTFVVLYRPLYESDWFKPADYQARPLEMFNETVTVGENTVPRFRKIEDPDLLQRLQVIKSRMY